MKMPCLLGPATGALLKTFGPSYSAGFERLEQQRAIAFEAILTGDHIEDERVTIEMVDHHNPQIRYELRSDLQTGHEVFMTHVNCQRSIWIHTMGETNYFIENIVNRYPRDQGEKATSTHGISYYTTQSMAMVPEIVAESLVGEPLSKLIEFPTAVADIGATRIRSFGSNGIQLIDKQWEDDEQAAVTAFHQSFLKD